MAGPRQPIELVVANGRKHLTKEEIEERWKRELKPCTDEIVAPSYLTAKEKKDFYEYAAKLEKLQIMGETDCDTLASYITTKGLYEDAIKDLRAARKARPKGADATPIALEKWVALTNDLIDRQKKLCNQALKLAKSLGLTIDSRCRLVAPIVEEKPKENKFSKFGKESGGR